MPMTASVITPRTKEFASACMQGRAIGVLASVSPHFPVLLFSIYGWASDGEMAKSVRTDELAHAVQLELA
eukprot:5459404-Alexandrium_andersonii.AAC.1